MVFQKSFFGIIQKIFKNFSGKFVHSFEFAVETT